MNEKEDKKLSHGRDSKATQKCMDMKLQEELYIHTLYLSVCMIAALISGALFCYGY